MTALGESAPRSPRLGRYELITPIGHGGMAEVQLALQRGPAGFEKLVVVKLVHENLASQKAFVDMLLDEARVAALVKHPNVVDIYDLGEAEGRYFIAMEYLEGEPLLAVLRAGRDGRRLDVLSTARLIADTAEGLEAAHELRSIGGEPIELVHHDVSLGNIVVLYNGQVKLVDFGVAKASQSATARTRIQGKFSYMAPEKLRGGPGDRRSDIWSLGCVLWEALTLRRLFKGGNDSDTMQQVLTAEVVAPSVANSDVPADFDPIVLRALDRDPDHRYATAKTMASDLEDVLRKHGYAAKNDMIARYMQATFESHIAARKKLLQEVSSKGRASPDIVEAAFHDEAARRAATPSGEITPQPRSADAAPAVPTPPVMPAAPAARAASAADTVLVPPGALSGLEATELGTPDPRVAALVAAGSEPSPADAARSTTLTAVVPSGAFATSETAVVAPDTALTAPDAIAAPSDGVVTTLDIAPMTTDAIAMPRGAAGAAPDAGATPVPGTTPDSGATPDSAVTDAGELSDAHDAIGIGTSSDSDAYPALGADTVLSRGDDLLPGASDTVLSRGEDPLAGMSDTALAVPDTVLTSAPRPSLPGKPLGPFRLPVARPAISRPGIPSVLPAAAPRRPIAGPAPSPARPAPPAGVQAVSAAPGAIEPARSAPAARPTPVPSASTSSNRLPVAAAHQTARRPVFEPAQLAIGTESDDDLPPARSRRWLIYPAAAAVVLAVLIIASIRLGNQAEQTEPSALAVERRPIASGGGEPRATADDPAPGPTPPNHAAEPAIAPPVVAAEPPRAEPPRAEPPRAEPPRAEPPRAEPPHAEPPHAAAPPAGELSHANPPPAPLPAVAPSSHANPPPVRPTTPAPQLATSPTPPSQARSSGDADAGKPHAAPHHAAPPPHVATAAKPAERDKDKDRDRDRPDHDKDRDKDKDKEKINPSEVFKTGLQAWVRGDTKTALATYKRVLQSNPEFAPAWRGVGLVYEKLGDKPAAHNAFQKYLQLAPGAFDAAGIRARLEGP